MSKTIEKAKENGIKIQKTLDSYFKTNDNDKKKRKTEQKPTDSKQDSSALDLSSDLESNENIKKLDENVTVKKRKKSGLDSLTGVEQGNSIKKRKSTKLSNVNILNFPLKLNKTRNFFRVNSILKIWKIQTKKQSNIWPAIRILNMILL
jgi:hypothetical protein